MVGAGRVAERRPDAAVALGDQVLARRAARPLVAPVAARPLVQVLGERLGEPVGERLDHDRAVVVVLGLEARGELVGAVDRDRERAEVVAGRRDVVGEASGSGASRRSRPAGAGTGSASRPSSDDVVALGARRPEAVDAARPEQLVARRSRRAAPARRRRARAPRAARGSPGTCPSAPTRGRRTASRCTARSSRASARRRASPVNDGVGRSSNATRVPVRARRLDREQRLAARARRAARAAAPAARGSRRRASRARSRVEQARDDADDARGVEHVHRRLRVLGRDPHRGVLLRRRRAADQQRQVEAAPLHLARDVDHLVERRRDQARRGRRRRAPLGGAVSRIWSAGTITPRSIDLVVVAAEHDADDVLADVVHVALDGGEHDLALRARAVARRASPPP